MFEVDDKKLGRAKVVNITEARQSMASIMTDQDFSYIITKNNQPIRVILSYEVLNRIQDGGPVKGSSPKEKSESSRKSIQGLLREREEDIKRQQKPVEKPAVKKAVGDLPPWAFKEEVPKAPPPPVFLKKEEPSVIPVADTMDDDDDFVEDVEEEVLAEDIPASSAVQSAPAEDIEEDFTGDFFDTAEDDALVPPPPADTVPVSASARHNVVDEPVTRASEEEHVDDDYFSRFKKLYEGASKKLAVKPSFDFEAPKREAPATVREVSRPAPQEKYGPTAPDPKPVMRVSVPAATVTPPPLPKSTPPPVPQAAAEAVPAQPKKSNDFPSIEELLEELEKEKLTGE